MTIIIPVIDLYIVDFEADVVDVNIPFLFGLDVMTELKALLAIGDKRITSTSSGRNCPLTQKLGHSYFKWPTITFYTVPELRKYTDTSTTPTLTRPSRHFHAPILKAQMVTTWKNLKTLTNSVIFVSDYLLLDTYLR